MRDERRDGRRDDLALGVQSMPEPEQRVRSEEAEGSDEQCGHAPEGPEEPRVFFAVVVRGVRDIACEFRARAWMALLARGHDVRAVQVRTRVPGREDVVRSMSSE